MRRRSGAEAGFAGPLYCPVPHTPLTATHHPTLPVQYTVCNKILCARHLQKKTLPVQYTVCNKSICARHSQKNLSPKMVFIKFED